MLIDILSNTPDNLNISNYMNELYASALYYGYGFLYLYELYKSNMINPSGGM